MSTPPRLPTLAALTCLAFGACQPSEAPRVELPVVVDASGLEPTTSDLGWSVELDEARIVIHDLQFTTAGEIHDGSQAKDELRIGARLRSLIEGQAWAHPGHYQGGEIIGELPGTFVIDFATEDGRELGLATLIVDEYTAINFGLGRAADLDPSDPLAGHTVLLRGRATGPGGEQVQFSVTIDSPLDREIIGVPFEVTVTETSAFTIGLRLLSEDHHEGDTLFDTIDFAALDAADGAADGVIALVDPEEVDPDQPAALSDAYYEIRRDLQTHDLFDGIMRAP